MPVLFRRPPATASSIAQTPMHPRPLFDLCSQTFNHMPAGPKGDAQEAGAAQEGEERVCHLVWYPAAPAGAAGRCMGQLEQPALPAHDAPLPPPHQPQVGGHRFATTVFQTEAYYHISHKFEATGLPPPSCKQRS